MSRAGMKFDESLHKSSGNFLNSYDKQITEAIRASDNLSPERTQYQQKLRSMFAPEFVGYEPKNPIYREELDRNFNNLLELRIRAGRVAKDAPLLAQFALLREVFTVATSPIQTAMNPAGALLNIIRSYSDGLGEIERAKVMMMKEFHNQSFDYVKMSNLAYENEKKDSPSWKIWEMFRADVSRNRLEHFFNTQSWASLHHDVTIKISEMEKVWRGEEARLAGASQRRATGVLGDTVALVLPIYLIGKSIKNKVASAIFGSD
jgi:hypothetical protein